MGWAVQPIFFWFSGSRPSGRRHLPDDGLRRVRGMRCVPVTNEGA